MQAKGRLPKDDSWKKKYKEPTIPDTSNLPSLPESWCWVTCDQLASFEPNSITDGPFGSNLKTEHYTESGPRVIRLQNVGSGIFIDEKAHISDARFEKLAKHHLKTGDIVIAMLGERLPRACIIPPGITPALVKADCARLSVNLEFASNQYINFALNAEPTNRQVASIIHGVGRPRLNLSEIRSVRLPLPNFHEQQKITEELEKTESIINDLDHTIDKDLQRAERLRQSILKQAFEGNLVPQDPDDEPASVLCERIKAEKSKRELEAKVQRKSKPKGKRGKTPPQQLVD